MLCAPYVGPRIPFFTLWVIEAGTKKGKKEARKSKVFWKGGKSRSDSLLFPYAKEVSFHRLLDRFKRCVSFCYGKKLQKPSGFSTRSLSNKLLFFSKILFVFFRHGLLYRSGSHEWMRCMVTARENLSSSKSISRRRRRLRRQLPSSSERDFSLPISAESAKSNSGKTRAAKREERRKKRGSAILFLLFGEALRGAPARLKAFYRGAPFPNCNVLLCRRMGTYFLGGQKRDRSPFFAQSPMST